MSRFLPTSQTTAIFYADYDTIISLPLGPSAGQPIVPGYEIIVVDNLQQAGASPITVFAPLSGGGTSVLIDARGGGFKFRWTGAFYTMV